MDFAKALWMSVSRGYRETRQIKVVNLVIAHFGLEVGQGFGGWTNPFMVRDRDWCLQLSITSCHHHLSCCRNCRNCLRSHIQSCFQSNIGFLNNNKCNKRLGVSLQLFILVLHLSQILKLSSVKTLTLIANTSRNIQGKQSPIACDDPACFC